MPADLLQSPVFLDPVRVTDIEFGVIIGEMLADLLAAIPIMLNSLGVYG